jgi:hypothetical protein
MRTLVIGERNYVQIHWPFPEKITERMMCSAQLSFLFMDAMLHATYSNLFWFPQTTHAQRLVDKEEKRKENVYL